MSTKSRVTALDPTYLEQSGLDPQQLQKEIDAAVKQATAQTQIAPPPSTSSSPAAPSPPTSSPSAAPSYSYNAPPDAAPPPQTSDKPAPQKPEPWKLDPTYLEQSGLDPQQLVKRIEAAVRSVMPPAPPPTSKSQQTSAGRRPSILDIISKLDPTTADPSTVQNVLDVSKMLQLTLWTSGGQPTGGSDRDYTKGWGLLGSPQSVGQQSNVGGARVGAVPADYLLDQRNPVNVVSRLSDAYASLKEELEKTVSKFSDVLQFSGGGIDVSKELKEKTDRYSRALDELKSLPDVEKALRDKFGGYVAVSGGQVDLAPELKKSVQRLGEFSSAYDSIMYEYKAAVDDIIKRYGLQRDKDGRLVVPPDVYGQVKAELEAVDKKYGEALDKLYAGYGDLFNRRVVDGRVVYELKPEVQAALVLQGQVAEAVKDLAAAQQKALQDVLNKYSDVLTYDPKTGRVAPSRELEEMLNRHAQAAQEVGKLIGAMSTVAGMIPTFAQQLPVITVKFQTYDKTQNKWVETGGETPIYVRDEKMREEIRRWMEQNKDKVKVAAFYDANRPVVYVYNDRDEGYIINPATGEARRAKGVSGMVDDTAKALWYKSLTDEEKKELEQYYKLQWEKEQTKQTLQSLPPVVREIYGALITAGQYAPISSSADIIIRAVLGQENPLAGAKKIHAQAEAVKEVSPLAYDVGTGVGLGGMVGLAAESILARGAAKLAAQGAKNVVEDISKFALVKKPEFPVTSPIQHVQQTAKIPAALQTAVAGLREAAVPMAVSGAAFGGLEGVKSYLETGKVDASRVIEAAAFGSLMGALPLTKTQALAALGAGAGAVAGSSLIRGYDLPTSLAVGESAGLLALVGGGLKELSGTKTPGAKAPEVKITDFAAVVEPRERPAPRVDLSAVDLSKKLSSAVGNVVADVVSGRVSVEEANLRLGAFRDAVPDKALFDKILQSYKSAELPKAPALDFVSAAKKAAEVASAAESGKLPEYRAFVELADLRASVADKARFDRLFGAKLREYGEQYVNWLLNSGLDKPSAVLNLRVYEAVLGRRLIERYVPDYGKVLAEIEAKLSQLRPVSPREAPAVRLTPEEVSARVKSLFDDVVEGRMDWFKASEELYKMWRDAPPEVRADLEAALNQLNRVYGEKYGVTLEPWRPSLLESALRRAELFAADVRAAVENVLRSFRQRLERGEAARLYEEAIDAVNKFRAGEIGLEEARRRLLDLAKKAERVDKELGETFKKKADELGRAEEKPPEKPPQKQPELRLPDEREAEWIRRAEEDWRRRMERRKEEGSGRGQQQLLLLEKERPEARMRAKQMRRGWTPLERPTRVAKQGTQMSEYGRRSVLELSKERPTASETVLQMGDRQGLVQGVKEGVETEAALASDVRQSVETALRQVLTPEVRSSLVRALEVRANAIPEAALAPEIRHALRQAQEFGRRLAELDALLKSPRVVQLLLRKEPPEEERRTAIPLMRPTLQAETPPQYTEPPTYTPKTPEYVLQYEPTPVPTSTTPTTAEVATPTYTPVTVPKISEVPAVDVPTVPTYETTPVPQPEPLPPGWWRLLPPSLFTEDAKEGAYKVQAGKRQILALA